MLRHEHVAQQMKSQFGAQLCQRLDENFLEGFRVKQAGTAISAGRQEVEMVSLIIMMLAGHGLTGGCWEPVQNYSQASAKKARASCNRTHSAKEKAAPRRHAHRACLRHPCVHLTEAKKDRMARHKTSSAIGGFPKRRHAHRACLRHPCVHMTEAKKDRTARHKTSSAIGGFPNRRQAHRACLRQPRRRWARPFS